MLRIARNADGDEYIRVDMTAAQRAALMGAMQDGGPDPCVMKVGPRVACSEGRDEVMGCRGNATTTAGDVAACGAVLLGLLCVPVAAVIVLVAVGVGVVKWLVTR